MKGRHRVVGVLMGDSELEVRGLLLKLMSFEQRPKE